MIYMWRIWTRRNSFPHYIYPSLTFDPRVIDLPLTAACRLAQEMLPAEKVGGGPNVGFDLWPAMWVDWQQSEVTTIQATVENNRGGGDVWL